MLGLLYNHFLEEKKILRIEYSILQSQEQHKNAILGDLYKVLHSVEPQDRLQLAIALQAVIKRDFITLSELIEDYITTIEKKERKK